MRFGKTLTVQLLVVGLVFALSAGAQQKPLTQDQVQGLVRSGLGDETGGKLIEQRGLDFAPSEEFLQGLRGAGVSEAFIAALRTAKHPESASAKKPLNQEQIFALLVNQVPSHRVTVLVQERGIDFDPTADYLQEVRLAGGEDELISALKSANVTRSATLDVAAQARQAEVRQHVARGAEFFQKRQYPQAEQEYRAALLLNSENADLYVSLAYILDQQSKWDDAVTAAREALRLNPNNAFAHSILGLALEKKGDRQGALAEDGTAYTLDPNNPQFKQAYDRLSQPLTTVGPTTTNASASCVILKRMGPADEVTSHLYSFGIRGKQFQYVEGSFPKGVKWHGRLTDNDVREIQNNGGKFVILEPKYTDADLESARKSCKQ
ncbi:MAG TPA: tetratricopeptide repeat protein [Terriglobia bacterium]|nr:tetratricopeptide repeat protein [Terriglobia bacterium]